MHLFVTVTSGALLNSKLSLRVSTGHPERKENANSRAGTPRMEFVSEGTYYGKHCVRVLQHRRQGSRHDIKEVTVNTHLSLATQKDYIHGDNADVVATDSQKNTVYAVAKTKGVSREI